MGILVGGVKSDGGQGQSSPSGGTSAVAVGEETFGVLCAMSTVHSPNEVKV